VYEITQVLHRTSGERSSLKSGQARPALSKFLGAAGGTSLGGLGGSGCNDACNKEVNLDYEALGREV